MITAIQLAAVILLTISLALVVISAGFLRQAAKHRKQANELRAKQQQSYAEFEQLKSRLAGQIAAHEERYGVKWGEWEGK